MVSQEPAHQPWQQLPSPWQRPFVSVSSGRVPEGPLHFTFGIRTHPARTCGHREAATPLGMSNGLAWTSPPLSGPGPESCLPAQRSDRTRTDDAKSYAAVPDPLNVSPPECGPRVLRGEVVAPAPEHPTLTPFGA